MRKIALRLRERRIKKMIEVSVRRCFILSLIKIRMKKMIVIIDKMRKT